MSKYFNVKIAGSKIHITNNTISPLLFISIHADHHVLGHFSLIEQLSLKLPDPPPTYIFIHGFMKCNGQTSPFSEFHFIEVPQKEECTNLDGDYRPGDILVACDNMNGLPPGYMGHAAIATDDEQLIESIPSSPIIKKKPITDFIKNHPKHAHFRPKSTVMGEQAAKYALDYLKRFQENKKRGEDVPDFRFTILTPLKDEWTYIYCSKLVWLSYYYGADYEFKHDGLWFAPEDLYSELKDNPEFELMYIHPDYNFKINI